MHPIITTLQFRYAILPARTKTFLTVVSALVIIAVSICWIFYEMTPGTVPSIPQDHVFFTIDDGVTWFKDDAAKIPPFNHEGKPAYRVYVFTRDDGKTAFAGYLQRFTPAGQKRLAVAATQVGQIVVPAGYVGPMEIEVKRPGDAKWVSLQDQAHAAAIMGPLSPIGKSDVRPVLK